MLLVKLEFSAAVVARGFRGQDFDNQFGRTIQTAIHDLTTAGISQPKQVWLNNVSFIQPNIGGRIEDAPIRYQCLKQIEQIS